MAQSIEHLRAVISSPAGAEELRLDFGSGPNVKEGFTGVDLLVGPEKIDLMRFPLPWRTDSVSEINCRHFIQYLPLRNVEPGDIYAPEAERLIGKDFFIAFFEECYRILAPGRTMSVNCPNASSDGACADPSIRRTMNQFTFIFLNKDQRHANGAGYLPIEMDFHYVITPIGAVELTLLSDDARARKFNECRNMIHELQVVLTKKVSG